ncbi:helix-turn-helix domain-containing protein [Nonomuraea sp. NPDC005650]|uniref:helix-turn-helix domain-containing protein n=1 Tax=Nonomuraea sp. NPDC005650 TaxID=3157045 RepID=UPI0033B75271
MANKRAIRQLSDPGAHKALGHPLRQRILQHLGIHGPATSTTLGRALGENTGTLSYHLRQLEHNGFIEEIPERSTGRERWWRQISADLRWPSAGEMDEESQKLLDEITEFKVDQELELARRFFRDHRRYGEWAKASRGLTHLTQEELDEFFEAYMELLSRFSRTPEDASPSARPVFLRFFTMPATEDPPS